MNTKASFFDFSNLRGDIFGGITAGVVALPLALAFGVSSGMGAIAGLYGAIAVGLLAALFGGTPSQVSGPTGPMTVVTATVVAGIIEREGSLEKAFATIVLCFFLAGLLEMLMGIFKLGQYIKYIPYPVVSGFMSGIGVIVITLQIPSLLGQSAAITWATIDDSVVATNWFAMGLALITVLIIYASPYFTKIVPGTLIALIIGTLIAFFGNWNIPKIGEIPTGLPVIHLPYFRDFGELYLILSAAITLAALGAIDSLLTSLVADNVTKTNHKSNQELVGQGLGNMFSAIIGGIPGAGATMRTLVNIKSGGKTKISGTIHSLLLIAILLGLGPLASEIPMAVLAGILITVGISIIDYVVFRHIRYVPFTDTFVMLVVLAMTVFVDLLQAVAVGMVLSSIFFMKKMSDLVRNESTITKLIDFKEESWLDELEIPPHLLDNVAIKHIGGPLFFGSVYEFQKLLNNLEPDIKVLILRMEKVPYIDQSGLYAIQSSVIALKERNTKVLITGIGVLPLKMLEDIKMLPDILDRKNIFDDLQSCLNSLNQKELSV